MVYPALNPPFFFPLRFSPSCRWAYERAAITQWIHAALATKQVPYSPFNGIDLSQTQMQPHYALRAEIERWYAANAQYIAVYQASY